MVTPRVLVVGSGAIVYLEKRKMARCKEFQYLEPEKQKEILLELIAFIDERELAITDREMATFLRVHTELVWRLVREPNIPKEG